MASHVGTVAFVAMLPHFLMISSVINNDGLFILFNTLLVWLIVRSVCAETVVPGQMVAIGAVFGLCLLTKGSAVAMIPLMLLVALMHSKEEREYSVRKLFIYSATIFVPAFIIAGWWYVWYAQVHGRMYLIPKAGDPPMRYDSVMELLQSGNAGYLIWRYLVGIAKSIWSQVDWILPNDPAHPEQATSAAYPVSRLIWIGMMLNMLSQTLLNIPFLLYGRVFLRQFRGILLTYCHFGCYFLALMYSTLFIHPGGFQGGRYLLPSVCALAIFFQLPWFVLGSYFPGERMRYAGHYMVFLILVSPFLLILWNVTCIKNLIGFLIPVYSG
jgi:hypothetical protein